MIISSIQCRIKNKRNQKKWRISNLHNSTFNKRIVNMENVIVGNYTYGDLYVHASNDINTVRIGHFCSIAENVSFLVSSDHEIGRVSTFPYKTMIISGEKEGISKGNIVVGDDVWIGYGATILSGVHIGQGAVIAAGSVVTDDVEPYTVVGGVPAKKIKRRFSKEIIDYLLTLDYSKLNPELIIKHEAELYRKISDMDLEDVKSCFDWFPKKPKQ